MANQTFTTSCEPRFASTALNKAILLWVCHDNETEPTAEEQFPLCQFLLEQEMIISECIPPNGGLMILHVPLPLPAAR